jgi:hypothetical protein
MMRYISHLRCGIEQAPVRQRTHGALVCHLVGLPEAFLLALALREPNFACCPMVQGEIASNIKSLRGQLSPIQQRDLAGSLQCTAKFRQARTQLHP